MLLNIQSMNPSASSCCNYKIKELEALLDENKSSGQITAFIAITESWLDPHIADAQIRLSDYAVYRCDRIGRGGGVCLYIHESLSISDEHKFDDGICQCLITNLSEEKICVIVVYRPPNADTQSFNAAISFINTNLDDLDDDYQIILTGDLNFPIIDWSQQRASCGQGINMQRSANQFLELLSSSLLNQYVNKPTRGDSILDIFCTNNPYLVNSVDIVNTDISDHNIVQLFISIRLDLLTNTDGIPEITGFAALDFSRANYNAISDAIESVDWLTESLSQSLEQYPEKITKIILEICQKYVPLKKIRTGKPRIMNSLRRKRKRLEKRLKESSSRSQQIKLERELALIHYDIKEAYMENRDKREQSVIQNIKKNPKIFFGYAKSHSNITRDIKVLKNKNGIMTRDVNEICDILQDQFCSVYSDPAADDIQDPDFPVVIEQPLAPEDFEISNATAIAAMNELKSNSAPGPDGLPAQLLIKCREALSIPLTLMWKKSFRSGIVPEYYKLSYVHPLHKKGDRVSPENFRAISLTSHVMKTAERVVRRILIDHLDRNNLITDSQHGFRSGRNTLTQLLAHFERIFANLANGDDTDTIYLDYAKAFDKVDHQLLLKKMTLYGFPANIVKWISSFLVGRFQSVVIKVVHSHKAPVISGVPQGTVLGPVLFLIFVNDLGNKLFESTISFFADDTRMSHKIQSLTDKHNLQGEILDVLEWSRTNNMELNQRKFELLIHHSVENPLSHELPFCPELYNYEVANNIMVEPSDCLRDLGVIVSNDFSWSAHIAALVVKARGVISWVLSVFKSRDCDVMLTLYKSLVRSHLEYCCPLWHPSKIRDIELIEGVQREFTSRVNGCQSLTYWERLQKLSLWSLQRRRERYILIIMWKMLNKFIPNTNIKFRPPSRLGIQAIVPAINTRARVANRTLYDGSFFVLGPTLWNALPSELTTIQTIAGFKKKLNNLVDSLPDNPPITGYMRAHNNSLPEVLSLRRINQGRSQV